MKTSLYSTLSSLAALTATAMFLSTACPALGAASGSPNNPDKVCKYKKKCPSCPGGQCDEDSKPEDDVKTKTVGHNEECPDPVTAGFGKDYELEGGGGARSARAIAPPVVVRSGFSADFINPKNLNVYGQGAEIVRDENANIRQIKTDTGFLDVISTPATKTVELRQYNAEDIGSSRINGVYPIKEGKTPLVTLRYVQEADDTIRVDTIDNANEFPSVKSERTKQTVGPQPYTLTQQKTYLKGEGLSAVEYRRVSKTITGIPGGQPKEEKYLLTTEDMGTDGQWHVTERKTGRRAEYKAEDGLVMLYECNAVNEDGTPMNPIATETTYTYYTDSMKPESFGKVRTKRRNDGYWENKYYDENANAGIEIEKTESPWLNTAAHEPSTAPNGKIRVKTETRCSTDTGLESLTETVDGIDIVKEWTEKSQVNQQMVREVRHQPHSGGDKVTTTVRYRRAKDVPAHLTGRTVSVHNADGSMSLYRYALNGQNLTISEDTGYGEGDSVSHGTRTVSTQDKDSGNLKEEVRYALEGGQAYWLGSKTGVNFDNKGVALKWVYDNNPEDYTEQRKDCCHVTWERGRDGIVTTYTYDAAGRQTYLTTRGIIYTTDYNGLTTIQWKQAEGKQQRYLEYETTSNLAQQTIIQKRPVIGNKLLTTRFQSDITEKRAITTTPYGTTTCRISLADGQILSETGTTGITQSYTYTLTAQNGGRLTVVAADGDRNRSISMDLIGNTLIEQSGHNSQTQHAYDSAGRIIKTVLPDGETQLFTYEGKTKINGIDLNKDGILNPTQDRMLKSERVFDSSWPEGKGSWKTELNSALNGTWITTHIQNETEDGSLLRSRSLGVNNYQFEEYPSLARQGNNYTTKSISPDNQITEMQYTLENGSIASIKTIKKDSKNNIISTTVSIYDIWGNMLSQSDSRTGTVQYLYDEAVDTLVSAILPDGSIASYQYDEYGRKISMTLPDKSQQHILYDSEGRIIRKWGSGQYPVSFEYNAYGQKISMTTYRLPVGINASWPEDAKGDKTTWIYDIVTGNLLHKNYADGKGITYSYTNGGKVKTLTSARGSITSYSYDTAGQYLKSSVNDNGHTPTQKFIYDQWGRIIQNITEGIVSYDYTYDSLGHLTGEIINIPTINGIFSRTIARHYDVNGRLSKYQLKQGNNNEQEVFYTYNDSGFLQMITADGKEFSYDYIKNSPHLLQKFTSPVHTTVNIWKDNKDDLLIKENSWKNKTKNSTISSYSYVKNKIGQRISVTTSGEAFGGMPVEWQWGYDALGQITSANKDVYSYDQIGNRRSYKNSNNNIMTSYQSNELNQYINIENKITPIYDYDGNLLTGLIPTFSLPDRNNLNFVYDANNRPIIIKENNQIKEERTYDSQSRRIKKGNTITLYDGFNAIAKYDLNTHTLKSSYAWGLDVSGTTQGAGGVGGLLCITQHNKQIPLTSYPCYDGNGNITEYLTEENNGTLVSHYEYDTFGNILKQTGDVYEYKFSTKPYDSITGLYYYNHRDYDPSNGKWLTRDPIEENGGINIYAFVANSSISFIDILGLAGNVTHGVEKCHNGDSCSSLASKAMSWILNYKERYKELMADKYNLKQKSPIEYNNHINELNIAKDKAIECISILTNKINSGKCCPPDKKNPKVPKFAPYPSPKPVEVPVPRSTSTSTEGEITGGDVAEGVVVVGATVGIGYLAYRAIRMIPSLFPPLWPTIPLNLACP